MRNFEVAKRIVVGCDPTRINLLNFALDTDLAGNSSLKAGVNMALYDIVGKIAGMPLFRLLGGYREKIATSVTIGLNSTDLMVSKARQIVTDGFRIIKIKVSDYIEICSGKAAQINISHELKVFIPVIGIGTNVVHLPGGVN